MSTALGQLSYLALGKEATAGTAVIPSAFVPFLSEKIKIDNQIQEDMPIYQNRWATREVSQGKRTVGGDIELEVEPNTIGHILNNTFDLASTTNNNPIYTHNFVVGDPESYTYEISKGGVAAYRYFGGKVDKLAFSWNDNKLVCTPTISFMGAFTVATVVTATGTALKLNTKYDDSPTEGLVAGDTLVLDDNAGNTEDVTIVSVTDDDDVVTTSISGTYAAGSSVYLKAQTASYSTIQPFLFESQTGGTQCRFGATDAAALTATHTPVDDVTYSYLNNLLVAQRSKELNAAEIAPKFNSAELEITQAFEDVIPQQDFLDLNAKALVIRHFGTLLSGTTYRELRITLNQIYQKENASEIKAQDIIVYKRNFAIAYKSGDGQAMDVKLVNGITTY